MNNHKYRLLNIDDLQTISQKRNNFIKCKGNIFCLVNTKQAIIITYNDIAEKIKRHFKNRRAEIIAELTKNDKTYLLLKCENLASIKALCKRRQIKAPKKIKSMLRISDLMMIKAQ